MMKCPNCNASDVSWEGYNHQEDDSSHRVCVACGIVLEEGSFRHDAVPNQGTNIEFIQPQKYRPHGWENSTLPDCYMTSVRSVSNAYVAPEGKKVSLRKIKELVNFICGPNNKPMLESCNQLFYQIYEDDEFKYTKTVRKDHIVGICVYITCRNRDIPISIDYICNLLGCQGRRFFPLLSCVKAKFGIQMKGMNLEALVDQICAEGDLNIEVSTLVKQLIPLIKDALIFMGKSGPAFVKAASYFAWQSLDFPNRKSVRFEAYLRAQKWPKPKGPASRGPFNKVKSALTILATAIPWVNVSKNSVSFYLQDILAYQKTIFHDLKCQQVSAENMLDCSLDSKEQNCTNAKADLSDSICTNGQPLPCGKRMLSDVECPKSKFMKFASLSGKEVLRLDTEELSEQDVSTEELNEYLRTPEEILQIHKLKALNGQDEK